MLDLHGLSEIQAKSVITTAIENAKTNGWEDIRIVTGRGNHINAKGERGTIYKNFQEWVKEVSDCTTNIQQFDGYYEVKIKDAMALRSPQEAFLNQGIEQYLTMNFATIKTQAEAKNYDDVLALAICYDNGYGVKRDYKKAAECYLQLLEIAEPDAMVLYEIGCRYLFGKGVRQNDLTALNYFTLSADKHYVLAEFTVGNMYWQGIGIPKPDYVLGNKYLKQAAEHNHAEAARKFAVSFRDGLGVTADFNQYLHWLKIAEKLGDAKAALNIFFIYDAGDHVTKDADKGLLYLERAVELGSVLGHLMLGMKTLLGIGMESDVKTGLTLIKIAAENKCNLAQFLLFQFWIQDKEKHIAIKYLIAAADNDHIEAQAIAYFHPKIIVEDNVKQRMKTLLLAQSEEAILTMINVPFRNLIIELILFQKDASKKQISKAISLLTKLANADAANSDMYTQLGIIYMWGHGHIKPNPGMGYGYWKQGADKGNAMCLCSVGHCFRDGLNGKKDIKKALQNFEAAAAKDDANAHLEIGVIYLAGLFGTLVNIPKAVKHFERAMELDKPADRAAKSAPFVDDKKIYHRAAENLGFIYWEGPENHGQDRLRALGYYEEAAEDGAEEAIIMLFEYYLKTNNMEKMFFFTRLAASINHNDAIRAMASFNRQSVGAILNYELASKEKIAEPQIKEEATLVYLLKQKSKLPFFAARDPKTKTVDAVVEYQTDVELIAVNKFNVESGLSNYGFFLYFGKQKPHVYALMNIDSLAKPVNKYLNIR